MAIFQKLSFKITMGIVLITSVILVSISYFIFSAARNEFNSATIGIVGNGTGDVVVRTIPDDAQFTPPTAGQFTSVKNSFNNRLLTSIIKGGVVGIAVAIVTGIIFSFIITQPLANLKDGIANLRKNKYKYKIEPIGEKELDDLIDEFNSLAKELSSQEQLRKDLISDVSHELKTPLTSIIGQIQGVKDKVFKLDAKRLELIQKDAERLNNLVDLLQEYSKLRSKALNIKLRKVNLYKVARQIADSHATDLKQKNIRLAINMPKNLSIKADNALLERIIENVLDNAIKYSQAENITIEADEQGFTITDNGIGIPSKDLNKIFERFYRVEKSRSRSTGGLGLGLALVKEMVEVHGWEINAFNNLSVSNNDKGTSFEIRFSA